MKNHNLTERFSFRKLTIAAMASAVTMFSASPVFAEDATVIDNVATILVTYYDKLSGIAIGVGILCAVIAVIVMVASPSDRGAETGKRWLVRILLGIGVLLSIGGIYSLIQDLTGSGAFNMESVLK